MAELGTLEMKVRATDETTGEPIAFSELSSFNPWPQVLVSGAVQGLVMALVIIGAHLAGIL